MTTYILRRLMQGVIVLFLVSVVLFVVIRLLPGDPLQMFVISSDIQGLTPEQLDELRHEYGLDRSLPEQYLSWVAGMFRGDFGQSIIYGDSVGELVLERLPVTFYVGFLAIIFSSLFGMLAGTICALRPGGWLDGVVASASSIGVAIPNFWLGILMIYLFGLKLGWLPIHGYTSPFEDYVMSTKQLIMPVFCLGVYGMAGTARQTRSAMLEVIRQDYIRTAWSKGLKERSIVLEHALKNGLIPVVTLIGMNVRILVGGSVLMETVFNIPGVGRLLVSSVLAQDFPVVQAVVIVIGVVIVAANLLVDLGYAWIDPRIRYA